MLLTAFKLTDPILDSGKVQALAKRFDGHGLQLDFHKVKSITAAGLGELVVLHKHLRAKGGALLLSHVDESVYEVFEATQLTRLLEIRQTVSWREEMRAARKRARKRRRANTVIAKKQPPGPGRQGLKTRDGGEALEPFPKELPALSAVPGETRPAKRRWRVLLIEDNRDAATSLLLLLECYGLEVAVAYSGPEGVTRAFTWRPDVVLTDIGLPGFDGWQVAEYVRRDPATNGARLIAITGYNGEEARQRSREVGFEAHLTKPVDPEDLVRMLEGPS